MTFPYTFFRNESPKITVVGAFSCVFVRRCFSLSLLESELLLIGSKSLLVSVFSFLTIFEGSQTGIRGCY